MRLAKLSASLLLAAAVALAHAAGVFVDRSGTITTGGTSQQLVGVNNARQSIHITHSTTATEPLCVNVTSAASCSAPGSYAIAPGGALCLNTWEAINIVAATTGHAFTAKEGDNVCVTLVNGGSATINGGGDASAANQVTGNNSLASIDTKTPALVSGRQPVTDLATVAQGSPTSGQSVSLSGAAVTTGAPTYTTGQTAPLSVNTSGELRITGTVSAGGVAQGSTTSGQTGGLTQAAVTTSAPTYTTGQTNPLSLTTAGGLRVDGSGVTQPVSGTVAATQSGNWTARLADGSGNNLTSAARGSERAISVQIVDASGNQVTSFGGSGGTASNFGSAVPSSGTAAGFSDGTNMQLARVFDADTGGGTQYVLGVNVRLGASGGGVELTGGAGAVAAGTLRVTQASDSPLVSAAGATGDSACGSDTGTCSTIALAKRIAQNLTTLNTSITADPNYSGVIGAATAPTRMLTGGGVYVSSAPTLTTGQSHALRLNASGELITATTISSASVAGTTAHDAAGASVNPVATGGYASAAAPTDVSADTDIVRDWNLRSGAKVIQPSYAGTLAAANTGNASAGTPRVVVATDQPAHALHGHGATGAAVPANAQLAGGRSGANMVAMPVMSTTAAVSVSTATTTQIVALSGSTQIYVGAYSLISAGTGNVTWVYGTGTNCGTGTTSLTGAIPLVANSGTNMAGPVVMVVPAGQALCLTTSAAVQVSGHVTYTQY